MYVVDSNIFLEVLLGQVKKDAAFQFFEKLNENSQAVVTTFSVHAIEAVLSSKKKNKELKTFLEFIQGHPFLQRYYTSTEEELEIAALHSRVNLDFDDALQYFVAKKLNATLVTFDKDFVPIKGVKLLML
jgi:uncharacterized protein